MDVKRLDWGDNAQEVTVSLKERKKLLDYAIFGIREKIRDVGYEFTNPDLSVKEIEEKIDRVSTLNWDLGELEDQRKLLEALNE